LRRLSDSPEPGWNPADLLGRHSLAEASVDIRPPRRRRSRPMYDPSRGYPSVVPCLFYDDVPAAARWLCETLGFREMVRATLPDGWVGHSEVERDGFVI